MGTFSLVSMAADCNDCSKMLVRRQGRKKKKRWGGREKECSTRQDGGGGGEKRLLCKKMGDGRWEEVGETERERGAVPVREFRSGKMQYFKADPRLIASRLPWWIRMLDKY